MTTSKTNPTLFALLAALLLTYHLAADAPPNPAFKFINSSLGKPLPIKSLPKNIPARPDKLSLYADFNSVKNGLITLYLINKTETKININAQDTDPYVKQQYRHAPKTWRRAQTHFHSWCGNSYFPVTSPPATYFKFYAFMPKKGKKATVRYHLYGQKYPLTSNAGPGTIQPLQVRFARYDRFALSHRPLDFVLKVIQGKLKIPDDLKKIRHAAQFANDRSIAVWNLTRFPTDKVYPVLKKLLKDKDKTIRSIAASTLQHMKDQQRKKNKIS